ncbi:unnamed protein product, partial [Fusarium langsethiae]
MTIIPPAIWSGDCPRTLLLHGANQPHGTSSDPRETTTLAAIESGPHQPDITSTVTSNRQTASVTSTKTTSGLNSRKPIAISEPSGDHLASELHPAIESNDDDPTSASILTNTTPVTTYKSFTTALHTTATTTPKAVATKTENPENVRVKGTL